MKYLLYNFLSFGYMIDVGLKEDKNVGKNYIIIVVFFKYEITTN